MSFLKRIVNIIPLRILLPALIVLFAVSAWTIGSTFSSNTNSIFFTPGTGNLLDTKIVSLKINSGTSSIGFVSTTFTFDKTKIRLNGEITNTSPFDTVIQKTTMADANVSGVVSIVLGVPPAKVEQVPAGTFEVVQIPVEVLSNTQNDTTSFTFDASKIQIVDMQSNNVTVDLENPIYTLNFATLTLSPTLTPTSQITPTEIPNPIITITSTPTTQAMLTNTPTSIPTSTPTVLPTATFTPTLTPTLTPTPTQKPGNRSGWFKNFRTNFWSRMSTFWNRN